MKLVLEDNDIRFDKNQFYGPSALDHVVALVNNNHTT